MKLGTENKFEVWTAVILGAIAVFAVGYWLMPTGTPPAKTPPRPVTTAANRSILNPLDPTLRLDLLNASEDVKYEGRGRNIFAPGGPEIPQPTTPVMKKPTPGPVVPQGPPPPPPINLKFFGVATRPGEAPRVLLSEGDSVFVAREGEIVNRRYRIVKINPGSVEVEDVLNNNRQSIPLSQG